MIKTTAMLLEELKKIQDPSYTGNPLAKWEQFPKLRAEDINTFLSKISNEIDLSEFNVEYDESGYQNLVIGDATNYLIYE